jgi:peptidoglycan/LPS O-acetylase OafA/YrhL
MLQADIRKDVQGLRALAVLGVILFHLNAAWLPGGFVGVDVFFVISGFIITNLILNGQKKFSWREFYWGRARRIIPAYLTTLIVTTFVAAVLFVPSDFGFYWQSLKSALRFISNSYFADFGDYFAPAASELPLLHMWSLAVEMQFYLLLPILLVAIPRKYLPVIFGASIFLGLGSIIYWARSHGAPASWHFSLWVRVPEFMLGVFWASCAVRIENSKVAAILAWVGALSIGVAFFACNKENFFDGYVLLPCVGAILLIAARGVGLPWLSSQFMVWLGGLSFSLYLWHWPALAFIRYVSNSRDLTLSATLLFVVVTACLSVMTWHFIEQPCRRITWQPRLLSKRAWGFLALALMPLLLAKQVNAKIVQPLDVRSTQYAAPDTICHGKVVGSCVRGNLAAKPMTLVIGDSHAAQLNLSFDKLGQAQGKSFQVLTASSCVPIKGFDVERISADAQKDCLAQINYTQTQLPRVTNVVMAGKWSYQLESKAFEQALNNFLVETAAHHQQVTILAQLPMFNGNPVRADRLAKLGITSQLQQLQNIDESNAKLAQIAQAYKHVTFKNFSKIQLFANAPFHDGQLIYMDAHHLNEVGAVRYAHAIGDQI